MNEKDTLDRVAFGISEIPASTLHEFGCQCAKRALTAANITDERAWNAIKVKRAWLGGNATDEELDAAGWQAEWAARDSGKSEAWAARAVTSNNPATAAFMTAHYEIAPLMGYAYVAALAEQCSRLEMMVG